MRRLATGLVAAVAAIGGLATSAHAQDAPPESDPPTTDDLPEYLPPDIDAEVFGTVCLDDTPYIQFRVVPINGFQPTEPVTVSLDIADANGDRIGIVELQEAAPTLKSVSDVDPPTLISPDLKPGEGMVVERVDGLVTVIEGQLLYPGADVLPDGTAFRWPGFLEDPIGSGNYVEIPGEEAIRAGLSIDLSINPTVSVDVGYPQAAGTCGGDDGGGGDPDCEDQPRSANGEDPCDTLPPRECPPDNPNCLPSTGSGSQSILQIAALVLAFGVVLFAIARRRQPLGFAD